MCVCRVGVSLYMNRFYSCTQMRGVEKKNLTVKRSTSRLDLSLTITSYEKWWLVNRSLLDPFMRGSWSCEISVFKDICSPSLSFGLLGFRQRPLLWGLQPANLVSDHIFTIQNQQVLRLLFTNRNIGNYSQRNDFSGKDCTWSAQLLLFGKSRLFVFF